MPKQKPPVQFRDRHLEKDLETRGDKNEVAKRDLKRYYEILERERFKVFQRRNVYDFYILCKRRIEWIEKLENTNSEKRIISDETPKLTEPTKEEWEEKKDLADLLRWFNNLDSLGRLAVEDCIDRFIFLNGGESIDLIKDKIPDRVQKLLYQAFGY